ncbi:MAG: hypothetical protein QE279_09155 [Rhodoferax sp.]|nr:hypothetical protein [Rhodoferax sp.]
MEKDRVIVGMSSSRRGGMALAAALAAATLAAGATAPTGGQAMRVIAMDETTHLSGPTKNTGSKNDQARKDGARVGTGYRRQANASRRKGPGWTNAHAQRVAAKVRAVKKHRAGAKGK